MPKSVLAEVTAPMRKLWMLNLESSKPAFFNTVDKKVLKWALVSGVPLERVNNGPGVFVFPYTAK